MIGHLCKSLIVLQLYYISLWGNLLTGSLPDGWGSLTQVCLQQRQLQVLLHERLVFGAFGQTATACIQYTSFLVGAVETVESQQQHPHRHFAQRLGQLDPGKHYHCWTSSHYVLHCFTHMFALCNPAHWQLAILCRSLISVAC